LTEHKYTRINTCPRLTKVHCTVLSKVLINISFSEFM